MSLVTHIEALKCTQCGAGISSSAGDDKDRVCDYCGSVLRVSTPATDSKPREAGTNPGYLGPKHCPRCHHRTVSTDVGPVDLRACHHCGGVWIPRKGLKRLGSLSKRHQRRLNALNQRKTRRGAVHVKTRHGTLHCPRCAHTMEQRHYSRGANITLDVCVDHGAWFDEHELRVAYRHIARRLGLRSKGKRWDRPRKFKGDWEYGALFVLFKVLAEILEEIFD